MVTPTGRTALKGGSIRKVEDHCSKVRTSPAISFKPHLHGTLRRIRRGMIEFFLKTENKLSTARMLGSVMVSSVLRKPGDCVFEFIDKVRAMMALSPPGSCHRVKAEEQGCSSSHPPVALRQAELRSSQLVRGACGVASLCKNTPSISQVLALEV